MTSEFGFHVYTWVVIFNNHFNRSSHLKFER
jgi:hypothetical protein